MVLFATDASPHVAMDGKLAAILVPNDMKCHLGKVFFHKLICFLYSLPTNANALLIVRIFLTIYRKEKILWYATLFNVGLSDTWLLLLAKIKIIMGLTRLTTL